MNGTTAVCFYGLLRSHREVSNSWKENIINPLNADIFTCCSEIFYAPSTSDSWASKDSIEKVDPQYLQNTYGNNIKKIEILKYDPEQFKQIVNSYNIPENNMLNNPPQPNQFAWRIFSMFYHIKNVLKLCLEYQKENHIKYDNIILSRPDLCIRTKINIEQLNSDIVYWSGDHISWVLGTDKSISDHLLISKQDNIIKLYDIYDNIHNYYKENIAVNQETLIGMTFIKNNISFDRNIFSEYHLVR